MDATRFGLTPHAKLNLDGLADSGAARRAEAPYGPRRWRAGVEFLRTLIGGASADRPPVLDSLCASPYVRAMLALIDMER